MRDHSLPQSNSLPASLRLPPRRQINSASLASPHLKKPVNTYCTRIVEQHASTTSARNLVRSKSSAIMDASSILAAATPASVQSTPCNIENRRLELLRRSLLPLLPAVVPRASSRLSQTSIETLISSSLDSRYAEILSQDQSVSTIESSIQKKQRVICNSQQSSTKLLSRNSSSGQSPQAGLLPRCKTKSPRFGENFGLSLAQAIQTVSQLFGLPSAENRETWNSPGALLEKNEYCSNNKNMIREVQSFDAECTSNTQAAAASMSSPAAAIQLSGSTGNRRSSVFGSPNFSSPKNTDSKISSMSGTATSGSSPNPSSAFGTGPLSSLPSLDSDDCAIIDLDRLSVTIDVPIDSKRDPPTDAFAIPIYAHSKSTSSQNRFFEFVRSCMPTSLAAVFGIPQPRGLSQPRAILNGISGTFIPGRTVALIGPSGSGKSTLLNVLAGRLPHTSGVLKINGTPMTKLQDIKKHSAFIQQVDLFIPRLTVEEHLITQIQLRLPPTLTAMQREEFAESILTKLGLTKCRNTPIGIPDTYGTGISGGERKRLSVATEIITNPQLLIADEPTTGLDCVMAASVVGTLRRLATSGRTVVASLHQPNTSLFATFDEVLLLAEGRVIYFGDRLGSIEWMSRLGKECPRLANPSDFLIRCVSLPDNPALRTAKIEELHQWANKWEAEGDIFLQEWTEGGRLAFFESSKSLVEKSIAVALSCGGFGASSRFSSWKSEWLPNTSHDLSDVTRNSILSNIKRESRQSLIRAFKFSSPRLPLTHKSLSFQKSNFFRATHGFPPRKKYVPRTVRSISLSPKVRYKPPFSGLNLTEHQPAERMTPAESEVPGPPPAAGGSMKMHLSGGFPPKAIKQTPSPLLPPDTLMRDLLTLPPRSDRKSCCSKQSQNSCGETPPIKRGLVPLGMYHHSFCYQLRVLTYRALTANRRDPILFYARFFQTVLIACILGDSMKDTRSKVSATFFVLTNQGLIGAVGVCSTFPSEKVVIYREIESGLLDISPYIIAKMAADVPIQTIFPILFNIITFSMMKLTDVWNMRFLLSCLVSLLVCNSAVSVGYLGSATADTSDVALITAQFWVLPALLFAGFVIKINDIPWPLRWIQYLSYFRYGYIAYIYLVFDGLKIPYKANPYSDYYLGNDFIRDLLGIDIGSKQNFWNQLIYLSLMILMLVIAHQFFLDSE